MPHQCTNCSRVFPDGSKEMLSGCPDCGGNKFQFKPKSATSRSADSDSTGSTPTDAGTPSEPEPTDPARHPTAPAYRESSPSTDDAPDGSSTSGSGDRPWPGEEPSSATADSPSASSSPPSPDPTSLDDGTDPDEATDTAPRTGTDPEPDPDPDAEVGREADAEETTDTDTDTAAEDHAQASARTDMVTPDELADAASPPPRPSDGVDGRVIEPESDDRPGLDELREELNSQFESIKIVSPGQYELNLMELYDRQEYIISLQEDGRYVIEVPDSWGDRDDE
jgi:hypothetical protein